MSMLPSPYLTTGDKGALTGTPPDTGLRPYESAMVYTSIASGIFNSLANASAAGQSIKHLTAGANLNYGAAMQRSSLSMLQSAMTAEGIEAQAAGNAHMIGMDAEKNLQLAKHGIRMMSLNRDIKLEELKNEQGSFWNEVGINLLSIDSQKFSAQSAQDVTMARISAEHEDHWREWSNRRSTVKAQLARQGAGRVGEFADIVLLEEEGREFSSRLFDASLSLIPLRQAEREAEAARGNLLNRGAKDYMLADWGAEVFNWQVDEQIKLDSALAKYEYELAGDYASWIVAFAGAEAANLRHMAEEERKFQLYMAEEQRKIAQMQIDEAKKQKKSGLFSAIGGAAGALIGAAVGFGPAGAVIGYGVGSGAGSIVGGR